MNLLELSYYLQNEEASKNYLLEKGILKNFTECPYCGSDKIGSIRRDRKRCYKCKKEWHQRKGSFLESRHISYSRFIGFLKLYADEANPINICNELVLERKSVQVLYNSLRRYIIGDKLYLLSENEKFELVFKNGSMLLESEKRNEKDRKPCISLSLQRYKDYGSIYSFLINAEIIANNQKELNVFKSFLSFLRMRSISYVGISEKYFLEYLVELIIKFNNRDKSYFDLLIKLIKIA
jgi:hypothetical protein